MLMKKSVVGNDHEVFLSVHKMLNELLKVDDFSANGNQVWNAAVNYLQNLCIVIFRRISNGFMDNIPNHQLVLI